MVKKHIYYKSYRSVIVRGAELRPSELRANGTYAASYKTEDGAVEWAIIVLEDHKIKYCYNLVCENQWVSFPTDEPIKIDFHIFPATYEEQQHAENFVLVMKSDEYISQNMAAWRALKAYKADIENSTWHKIAAALRKFFSL